MSNRSQRRAMMRAETKRSQRMEEEYRNVMTAMGSRGRILGLCQNGITPEDVRKEFERGQRLGFDQAGVEITKCCYAGIILALREEFDFNDEQCFQAIQAVDRKVILAIGHSELADQVLAETGMRLELDDPLERVIREE